MATVEEPILSRLDRLDNILKKLEEVRGGDHSPKTSTASSETLTSDGQASSLDFSPRSMEKHCRPIDDVITETEHKGTLIERLVNVENRVLNMCLQLEAELEIMKKKREENLVSEEKKEENVAVEEKNKSPYKKGLKSFVKSCVKGKGIGKHKHNKE
ncbi:uncharacterized protein LOC107829776 [Nicotiana tabacum]|uniref:Uncharacterized protein LOC107829776 n=2 Tax=Nicotiana TaxID=4085 RepID=A0A1S4DGX3_TOBAC|nr:PREDICTED: uncharacterized protein LOC104226597 [Nicotiana sylvestris]XP_016512732.1 PREDICTED: uncharacterized protein LOC107829776 [Nicotiana tabacum]